LHNGYINILQLIFMHQKIEHFKVLVVMVMKKW
jgi:hypothetical protein